ncbi:uncharacterized protein DSM5745_07569 [Aspergillus mulundensis]|uniref:Fe2OG dioxygenase domain-containing protein n=1 Tax=Aspergillus mulundensis TaxID=1810919 RepID=A0A3D8REA6_9EURO|nr:hypothetical protein DSM5745_07569 [Aspergillus mulundensis]RDW72397.1 hypothetical protein DSM5745_07569 [Aspergillus mulundensis]
MVLAAPVRRGCSHCRASSSTYQKTSSARNLSMSSVLDMTTIRPTGETHFVSNPVNKQAKVQTRRFAASEGMAFGLPAGQLAQSSNMHDWWDSVKIAEIEAFKAQCSDLTLRLLSCFAEHMDLPRTFFETSHKQDAGLLPGNALKFMKYPTLSEKPENALERLSAHTDWGTLTLLFTESPGLEIRGPNNEWHDVPVVPGGIVVNIGDLLEFWSGGLLKSTMHRISWEKVPIEQDRYSMPYFAQPSFDTDLRPLTGTLKSDLEAESLTYEEYYHTRIRLTWGNVLDDEEKPAKMNRRLAKYLDLRKNTAGEHVK